MHRSHAASSSRAAPAAASSNASTASKLSETPTAIRTAIALNDSARARRLLLLAFFLDLPGPLGRRRVDVAGGIHGPDLELMLLALDLERLGRIAGLEATLVELALERRARLVGGELELGLLLLALLLRALGDRGLGGVGVAGDGRGRDERLASKGDDRVGVAAAHVDVRAIAGYGHRFGPVEASHAGDTIYVLFHKGQGARRGVPSEGDDGVVVVAAGIDMRPVRRHRDVVGVEQPVHAVHAVAFLLEKGQGAGGHVAGEGGHGAVAYRRHVHVGSVGGDGNVGRAGKTVHTSYSVLIKFDERELTSALVAREGCHGVFIRAGDVHVVPVGRDRKPDGAVGPLRVDPVLVDVDEGQRPVAGVSGEGTDAVVAEAGDIDVVAVRRDDDLLRRRETIDPGVAVLDYPDPVELAGRRNA